jgi:hypothetical protein
VQRWSTALAIGMLCLKLLSEAQAQEPTPDFPAESMIRLTGILELTTQPRTSAYPLLAVWVGEKTGQFQVTRVESVVPEYPAEEGLRRVSGLGLRLLAAKEALAALQDPQLQGRPIVIEGWLQVEKGSLNIRSVRAVATVPSAPAAKGQAHP